MKVNGVDVAMDPLSGEPFWLNKGHVWLQQQVQSEVGVVGSVTKFVRDPRQKGAVAKVFYIEYAGGDVECLSEQDVQMSIRRRASTLKEERLKNRHR